MAESEIKKVERVREYFRHSHEQNANWLQRARMCREFYCGRQWDPDDVDILESQGRPPLTINRILPVINVISGVQRQNRRDLRALPLRGGAAEMAAIYTALLKHCEDTCRAAWAKSAMFVNGVITGKGWLGFSVDHSRDPVGGELRVEVLNPFRVYEDRSSEDYDLHDARYVVVEDWVDVDELKARYPKRKREIETETGDDWGDPADAVVGHETEDYNDDENAVGVDQKYRRRVRSTWHKEWARETVLTGPGIPPVRVNKQSVGIARALHERNRERYRIIEMPMPTLNMTITCGDVLLEHRVDPLHGVHQLPFIRFCPFHLQDNVFGVIDNLIGPQQELNKRRSQMLHHINQSSNSGWIGDEDALTPAQWDELEALGSRPGFTIRKKHGSDMQQVHPVPLAAGLFQLEMESTNDIREVSSINSDLQGLDKSVSESGRAMLFRQRQGLMASETIFDNWEQSMHQYGELLLECIRRGRDRRNDPIYTDEEVMQICAAQAVEANIGALRDSRSARYTVKVEQVGHSPTARMAMMEMLVELAKLAPVPPELIVEASDWPGKDKLIKAIAQARQAEQGQDGQAADAEIRAAEVAGKQAIERGRLALDREKAATDAAARGMELGMKARQGAGTDGNGKRDRKSE